MSGKIVRNEATNQRQKKFAEGVALGKSKVQAALDAGYAPSTALKQSYAMVDRPLVRSALTEALMQQGATLEKIVKPIVDGLEAKVRVTTDAGVVETDLPDHRIRGENVDRAVKLLGGIPRETEMPAPPRPGLVVVISRASDAEGAAATAKPVDRPVRPGKQFDMTFVKDGTEPTDLPA